jgi:hypothetical protein
MIATVDRRRLATLVGLAALVPAVLASGCGRAGPQALRSTTTGGGAGAGTTSTVPLSTAAATSRATTTVGVTTTAAATTTTTMAPNVTGKKATGKKATGKKATGKKATGKKATGKKATGKRTPPRGVPGSAPTTSPAAWRPASPAPSASQAAYELVEAWGNGSRKTALADASPRAVAALFANPYPAGGPQYRGCSTPPGHVPSSCVFRSGNDLLSLTTVSFPDGWGVTAALMES